MRKLNVDPTLLYPEQGAPSAVQAEVTTPHMQTSISYSPNTKDIQKCLIWRCLITLKSKYTTPTQEKKQHQGQGAPSAVQAEVIQINS